jgi:hypothetical protein
MLVQLPQEWPVTLAIISVNGNDSLRRYQRGRGGPDRYDHKTVNVVDPGMKTVNYSNLNLPGAVQSNNVGKSVIDAAHTAAVPRKPTFIHRG